MQPRPDVVAAVRAKFGALLTDDECGLLTNEVAYRLAQTDPAWGVSAKPNGKASTLPNGARIAHDILHYRTTNTLIDILQAAGAESRPQWAEVPYHGDPSGRPWLPAVDPATFAPTPVPGPTGRRGRAPRPTAAATPRQPPVGCRSACWSCGNAKCRAQCAGRWAASTLCPAAWPTRPRPDRSAPAGRRPRLSAGRTPRPSAARRTWPAPPPPPQAVAA